MEELHSQFRYPAQQRGYLSETVEEIFIGIKRLSGVKSAAHLIFTQLQTSPLCVKIEIDKADVLVYS